MKATVRKIGVDAGKREKGRYIFEVLGTGELKKECSRVLMRKKMGET